MIEDQSTTFDNTSAKYEKTLELHGRDSYAISEFANRLTVGTSKIVLGALMASLRHPDIVDSPVLL